MSNKITQIQVGSDIYDIEPNVSAILQVDNGAPTLAWNTTSTVGTVDGVNLTVKMPASPTINNGTLTIQKNGESVATFTANQSGNSTANISVPTKTSDLTNDSGFATNSSVDTKIAALVDSAPEALNTLGELATALEEHEDAYGALLQTVGEKANSADLATVATSGSYNDLTNKPTIPTGAAANKGVDTSIAAASTSTNLPTSKAVAAFVEGKGYKTTDNNDNQKVKTGSVTFGVNDIVEFVAGDNVTITGNATNKTIEISATDTNTHAVTSVAGKTGAVTLTKSDVGLGSVGNFKAVSTVASQGLTDTEKSNARANIGAGTSSFSGSYTDLTNKPTIPTVNNAALTLNVGGQAVNGNNTFTANDATATTYNVPAATASAYGVVKVSSVNSSAVTVNSESTTTGRYYPVELNSDGKAIVNVPWTQHTFSYNATNKTLTIS